jgi:hypothetical protein
MFNNSKEISIMQVYFEDGKYIIIHNNILHNFDDYLNAKLFVDSVCK